MKPYNEQEFNRLCAEFLGYVNTTPTDPDFSIYENRNGFIIDGKQYTLIEPMSMKFHSDWNWIMEVVETIERLDKIDKRVYFKISGGEVFLTVLEGFQGTPYQFLYQESRYISDSKKEAVIQAIWQFLNWHNEQKQ